MIRRAISDGERVSTSHLSTLSSYVNPPSAASLRAEITSARVWSGYLSSQLELGAAEYRGGSSPFRRLIRWLRRALKSRPLSIRRQAGFLTAEDRQVLLRLHGTDPAA